MHLALRDQQARIRDAARDFAEGELQPNADRFEHDEAIPQSVFEGLAERGLMGVNVASGLGGSEAGVVAYSLAMTEIARGCASTAVTMAVTNMVGEVISAFGTEEQKRRYNPALCKGRLGAFALSEVGAGSDPGGMRTTAKRDGDGWVLEGTKQWISHADLSDVMVVWARTGSHGTKGISCFLVEPSAEGVTVDKHEDKMGLRASHTCALSFEGVRVPDSALLGEVNGGFRIAMMALDGGRIGIASQALGIAEGAWDRALAWAKASPERAGAQGVQWPLADIRTELDAARQLTLRAAHHKERGGPFTREASMAKVFSTEASWRACNRALEIMGADGYRAGTGVERHLRDVRVTMIYEGTSEVQRLVISRTLLK